MNASLKNQPVPAPKKEGVGMILAALFTGAAIGVSASGFRLMAHTVPFENRIDAKQRALLDEALKPLREKNYREQLATGTVTVASPKGPVTLHCTPFPDGARDCDNGSRYSKDAFEKAVRTDSDGRIDRQFAPAYSDNVRVQN